MPNRKLAACGAAMLLLAACGGGGGGSPTTSDQGVLDGCHPLDHVNCTNGVPNDDLGPSGVNRDLLVQHLKETTGSGVLNDVHTGPITVRHVDGAGATRRERNMVARVVEGLNGSLPVERHIRIGAPISRNEARRQAGNSAVPSGTILVDIASKSDWLYPCSYSPSCGGSTFPVGRDTNVSGWSPATYVVINPDGSRALLTHEMMHAMGFWQHSDRRRQTITTGVVYDSEVRNTPDALYPLDRAALQVIYGHLRFNDVFDSLGPWDDSPTTGQDRYTGVTLGYEAANGHVRVWALHDLAYSWGPEGISDGGYVTGTATWRGRALGATVRERVIRGSSALTLDMRTMAGDLSLTGLTNYRDLRYGVELTPYGLTRVSGDAGAVYGHLYSHDRTAAGTVHRTDAGIAWAGQR
ncbi:MAG: hypothetical protein OXG16_12750 [Rhodospirillales bacterium]|nr:hypothetical protein [Rhodospirillales bacterium]